MPKDEIDLESVISEEVDSETALRPYEILTYPADYTLEILVKKWEEKAIRSPNLQRRFVWPQARASKLIESFLMGLPVPPVFLYQDREEGDLLIVDGHQRLRAIAYFFSGWFGEKDDPKRVPFELVGLSDESPFSGMTYQKLENTSPVDFKKFKDCVLRAYVMRQLQPADNDSSILEVFGRLNTGGMALHGQEIRNCVYEGEFNELLKKLNKNENWRKIVGTEAEDKRMRDIELILRSLALLYNVKKYEKPMKEFLNKFMREYRLPPHENPKDSDAKKKAIAEKRKAYEEQIKGFEDIFTRTAQAVVQYLDPKPFHILRGLNAAVFDSVFTAFALHIDKVSNGKATAAKIKQVRSKYDALLKNRQYIKWVSAATTDQDVVPKRLKKAETTLFG
ncbi:MAG: DUF262 domain-containing protein [Acidobacteria bacterium]|nr:DUF262 domain-containing protein [Acidobacteriota bacterium]